MNIPGFKTEGGAGGKEEEARLGLDKSNAYNQGNIYICLSYFEV